MANYAAKGPPSMVTQKVIGLDTLGYSNEAPTVTPKGFSLLRGHVSRTTLFDGFVLASTSMAASNIVQ